MKPAELSPLKRALLAIEELQAELAAAKKQRHEPIAIVGIGCRIPGDVSGPDQFWQLLREGRSGVREIPTDRWAVDAYYDPNPDTPGKIATRFGGFLQQVDQFEPQFFEIAPREALTMDPQQRLLLEVAWEALEHAGHSPANLVNTETGVYIGINSFEYPQLVLEADDPALLDMYYVLGAGHSIASGRLSYTLGLKGPSISVDTACSSSLVAVHLACRGLRNQECNLALAGGINVILAPEIFSALSRGRILAPDGKCKTFDAAADGFVRGEGCGVVVLKRLRDALANGDRILALIRGSAVNQDGPSSGLTAPNGPSQEAALRNALKDGNVDPQDVSYVEAHGTGTPLGDPIEVQALGAVFGPGRDPITPLLIGSLKTNVGHLEAAAGVCGLIKVVLSLQHQEIPQHLNFRDPSPHIPWAKLPVKVVSERQFWKPLNGTRIAGVSSFGFSGTNAHVLLEQAPSAAHEKSTPERPVHLLTISARTEPALRTLVERYAEQIEPASPAEFSDLCYTSNTGRSHFQHRLAVIGADGQTAAGLLRASLSGSAPPGLVRGSWDGIDRPKIAFLFTGQGSQYAGMGKQLYETSATFAQALDRCDNLLRPYLDRSLLDLLFADAEAAPLLDETRFTQPALFALEYALNELWRSWGVQPAYVLGHSVGEYVAACVAGVLSLEDGLALIAERARLMQAQPVGGKMVAVMAPADVIREILPARVSIAALNAPDQTVISGAGEGIDLVVAQLKVAGIVCRHLPVSHAFHSPLMDPVLEPFAHAAAKVSFGPLRLRLVSNLTGRIATAREIDQPGYWTRHLREPVQFAASIRTLAEAGCTLFVEIGPSPTLISLGPRCANIEGAHWLPSLRPGFGDWTQMFASLSQLYVNGVAVDWSGFDRDYSRRRLTLPTYPFQRERYFVERSTKKPGRPETAPVLHPLAARRVSSPALKDIVFESEISAMSHPFLEDYRVFGRIIFPPTAYVETVRAAANLGLEKSPWTIENLVIGEVLALEDSETKRLQTVLLRHQDGAVRFEVFSSRVTPLGAEETWRLHASGNLVARENQVSGTIDLDAFRRAAEEFGPEQFYASYQRCGVHFGPRFRSVNRVWRRPGQALGLIEAPLVLGREATEYAIHPALLDACIQVVAGAVGEIDAGPELFMPREIGSIRVFEAPVGKLWSVASVESDSPSQETVKAQFQIADELGRLVAEIRGMSFKRVERAAVERAIQQNVDAWLYETIWVPLLGSDTATSKSVTTLRSGELAYNPDDSVPRQPSLPAPAQPRRWLILGDHAGTGQKLADFLVLRGDQLALACAQDGAVIDRSNADENLGSVRQGGLDRLVGRYCDNATLSEVIYLWPLDACVESLAKPGCEHETEFYCGAVLQLVQALVRQAGTQPPRLWLCTRGAHKADPVDRAFSPAGAAVWGLGKVIGLEHPEFRCVRLDLDPSGTNTIESLVAMLDAESVENEIAIRSGRQLGARLQRLRKAPDPATQTQRPKAAFSLDADGTYLITGGFRGVGLMAAQWLADRGAHHLVLTGRQNPELGKSTFQAIQARGVQLRCVQADISDEKAMARVLEELRETMPPLRGVIHSAGVLDDGVLLQQNWERFATVFAPKVAGSLVLHRLTASDPLDFCVFFSSIASVFGSPGQGSYAAANAFMDSLALARNAAGQRSVSINWGAWAGAGMAVDRGLISRAQESGYGVLEPRAGFQALEAVLMTDRPQIMISPVDWPTFLRHSQPGGYSPAFLNEFIRFGSLVDQRANGQREMGDTVDMRTERGLSESAAFRQRLDAVAPNRRRSVVVEQIRNEVAHVLGLQNSGPLPNNKPLHEFGLDSLMAVELRNRLGNAVGHSLPATLLFDYPTVDGLTEYVSRNALKLEKPESPNQAAISTGFDVLSQIENFDDAEIDRLFESKGIGSTASE
jgi:acyl transferase domain-containing protein/acyl carrier protein